MASLEGWWARTLWRSEVPDETFIIEFWFRSLSLMGTKWALSMFRFAHNQRDVTRFDRAFDI